VNDVKKLEAAKRAYLLKVGLTEKQVEAIEDDLDRLADEGKGRESKSLKTASGTLNVVPLLTKTRPGAKTIQDVVLGREPSTKARTAADLFAASVWLRLAGANEEAGVLLKALKDAKP